MRAETIVLALRDHAVGDAYLQSGPVETLRHHDEQKGTSYVETLAAYFDAFGFVPSAAKAIFVHPNTFRYRLRRLTEISGLNLDDPLERLVAELQLRIFADGARPLRSVGRSRQPYAYPTDAVARLRRHAQGGAAPC